jgi:hypothetical protein
MEKEGGGNYGFGVGKGESFLLLKEKMYPF